MPNNSLQIPLHIPGTVAIDARMIHSSGIGVVLRSLLRVWARSDVPPRLCLYGDPQKLEQSMPPGLNANIVRWTWWEYHPLACLVPPKLPRDLSVWYSPHYPTCLAAPAPIVCHVHDLLHITHPPRPGTDIYMRVYLPFLRWRAKYVLTDCRHVKVQLQTLYGFKAHRVLHAELGPGLVAERPADLNCLPAALKNKEFLLANGLLKPHKNWAFLFEQLAELTDVDLPLVCLGLSDDAEKIRALARKHGLENRVILPGHLPEEQLASTMSAARALLFPSLAEGFGLPVLEAMAAGTPVVVAERSPMKEVAGQAGFFFDPDWPESFRTAVRRVLNDEDERQKRIAAGRARAQQFSWEQTTRVVTETLYRAATGKLP